ncbi:SGNH/GDSL hydrolase family protein [Spirosoma sordidisoli]|uniref:SGNH/GDSL hydrolase family protein n=1 Tax=Spirosoma sordidisoli TaxID=2502893 RepID=A0A4Q2UTF5_9BACT|nr:SGNH/GDSL hydrolase family protein [Spirosoma sordidisoli]RYC70099.1 SGNH/GDSL hydrolase family protein [Spirosoma sordidisoli]
MIERSLSVLVSLLLTLSATAQTDSLTPVVEATYRAGLPNFFHKIQSGQTSKVAYLGGSITRADQGWRDQTVSWLKDQYPHAKFEQIMAAIGGTGSDFGAYRLRQHVLQHKPDLVFVEFAVNDHGKTAQQVKASMEGIVRQIWKADRHTDICFVYTFQKVQLPFYQNKTFPVSTSAMETIADQYQIPSICLALPAIQLIEAGKMVIQGKASEQPDKIVFSGDGVHPYVETGHKLYAETVERHLLRMEPNSKVQKHPLPKSLISDNLQNVALLTVDKLEKSKGWHLVDSVVTGKPYASLMPPVYASADTADYITISFRGNTLGLVDVIGPGTGQIVVRVDNDPPRYINRFDEYCTYYRMSYTLISGLSDGKHTASIRVSPTKLDKASILAKRNNKITSPQLYEKQAFYIGAFLVRE